MDKPDWRLTLAGNAIIEVGRLEAEIARLKFALAPFAKMHREGSDPRELACKRGTGYDTTYVFSVDFERAAAALSGETQPKPKSAWIEYIESPAGREEYAIEARLAAAPQGERMGTKQYVCNSLICQLVGAHSAECQERVRASNAHKEPRK